MVALTLFTIARAEEPVTAESLLATADARIEQHRKADVTIRVVDAAGKPVPGVTVEVRQRRHAFLFGSNIYKWGRCGDPQLEAAYRDRYAELLNFATLPFYWWSYEREWGEPEHENRLEIARWCNEHGIETKGHPLAWNYAEPRWLGDVAPENADPKTRADAILKLQLDRIDDCMTTFRGTIDTWDVVNEAIAYERGECRRRAPNYTAMWDTVGREELVLRCLQQARKANPDATLLVNDFRVDDAYAQMLQRLLADGPDDTAKPLFDVIGIQSHMHGGVWPLTHVWNTCERYKRFDQPIHFTEMTIVSGKPGHYGSDPQDWPTTPEGEAAQAKQVAEVYTVLFSHPKVEAITWWDFSDLSAWRGAPAGLLREDMSPKPAYEALHSLIKGKWWTKVDVPTDDAGEAKLQGFLGEYDVTVSHAGQSAKRSFTLEKEGNEWMIVLVN